MSQSAATIRLTPPARAASTSKTNVDTEDVRLLGRKRVSHLDVDVPYVRRWEGQRREGESQSFSHSLSLDRVRV